jgi:hypothetical protein
MFGQRKAVLVGLAVYLFSVITMPAFIWWAAGINALPFQIAFFWGMHSQVSYLRTRERRHALAAMGWTFFGLLFFEKTLYLFPLFFLVALNYFCEGWGYERLRDLWRRYRWGISLQAACLAGYLAAYAALALSFDPNEANEQPLGPIASNLIIKAFGPGIVGGPLTWYERPPVSITPNALNLVLLASWALIAYICVELNRTRDRSKRAWLLVGTVLGLNVILLAAARAFVVGPGIALEYRYQTEVAGVAAVALCLAALPLRGAVEPVRRREVSPFADSPRYVFGCTAICAVLGVISNYQYAVSWAEADQPRTWFDNLAAEVDRLQSEGRTVAVPDGPVPEFVLWGLGYPDNQRSRMLAMFDDTLRYTQQTDELKDIDAQGRIRPATVTRVRSLPPGPRPDCGYFVTSKPIRADFDGPVIGAGWWMRIGYIAERSGSLTVGLGDRRYVVPVRAGLHQTFVQVDGSFWTARLSSSGTSVCTDEVTVGLPQPLPSS